MHMETSRSIRALGGSASRGQVWIIDAMVSGTFITLLLFLLLSTQMQLSDQYAKADREITNLNALLIASDSLVLTPGQPANWDRLSADAQMQSVGLASAPNVISTSKAARLQALNSTNYTSLKTLMGLGQFNTSVDITLLGNTTPLYSFGRRTGNETGSTVFERLAILDDNRSVVVRIEVG
jgi:hypothetical protein